MNKLYIVSTFLCFAFSHSGINAAQQDFEVCDGFTRSEFVRLDMNKQKDIYSGMTFEQKKALWDYKLGVSLEDERLTSGEKQELEKLWSNLGTPGFFDDPAAFQDAIGKWSHRMITKYGWSGDKLYYYTSTWMTEEELREYRAVKGIKDNPLSLSSGLDWHETEAWAEENLSRFRDVAHRDEFVRLPLNRQNAIYRLLTKKEKAALWEHKTDDILASRTLSAEEKDALLAYYKEFDPVSRPDDMDESMRDEVLRYKDGDSGMARSMKDRFGWDRTKYFGYCRTWLTEAEFQQYCLQNGIK